MRKIFATLLLSAACMTATAQDPWLHIYYPNGRDYQGFDISGVLEITFDETNGSMTVYQEDNETVISGSQIDFFRFSPNVATLRIDIPDDPDLYEVESKTIYLDGQLTFEGHGLQEDFQMPMKIRGRGNSTWSLSKKSYRLKFAEKQRMLLPKKAKNFVLLANHIDGSMMRNFAAFKFGEVVGMPWINHALPVDVYFNGNYKGSYMLTEKVGFNNGSVNIKAVDEPNSVMLEFDTNGFNYNYMTNSITGPEDDVWFTTTPYDSGQNFFFTVTVKDPDAPADPTELNEWRDMWKADIDELMTAIEKGQSDRYFELCDLESLVRYIMVFNFTCNQEIDHPKSVYMYKTLGGKWNFGPCWDFDWAFGYEPTYETNKYMSWENPLLSVGERFDVLDDTGGCFFYKLCNTPEFKARFNEIWDEFLLTGQDKFWADFDAYTETLRPSAALQGLTRTQYTEFDKNVSQLRTWLQNRIEFITSDTNHGLWRDEDFINY